MNYQYSSNLSAISFHLWLITTLLVGGCMNESIQKEAEDVNLETKELTEVTRSELETWWNKRSRRISDRIQKIHQEISDLKSDTAERMSQWSEKIENRRKELRNES